jgi:hypothetical protein
MEAEEVDHALDGHVALARSFHTQGRAITGTIGSPSRSRRASSGGTSLPRMNSDPRNSAETSSTATLAVAMTCRMRSSQSSPAPMRRSSHTAKPRSSASGRRCLTSRSFSTSSAWL